MWRWEALRGTALVNWQRMANSSEQPVLGRSRRRSRSVSREKMPIDSSRCNNSHILYSRRDKPGFNQYLLLLAQITGAHLEKRLAFTDSVDQWTNHGIVVMSSFDGVNYLEIVRTWFVRSTAMSSTGRSINHTILPDLCTEYIQCSLRIKSWVCDVYWLNHKGYNTLMLMVAQCA